MNIFKRHYIIKNQRFICLEPQNRINFIKFYMSERLDYTARAIRVAFKYPLFSHLSIQINFWFIAHLSFGLINYLILRSFMPSAKFVMGDTLGSSFLLALILSVLFGISFGMIEYYLENRIFRRKSLGRVMILKAILSFIVSLILFYIIKYVLF